MGMIDLLFDALGFVIYLLEFISIFADIIAYIKAEDNRFARKAARKSKNKPPKKDKWSKAFIFFSITVIMFTSLILIKLVK